MNPKISIIIPVYNAERYLYRCIDSVISQSYKDWELILVNDGSMDRSGEICDEYVSQMDNIHDFHKENGGVSTARNLGLEKAIGEWVAFVDADDSVLPGWLQCVADNILESEVDLYMWGIQIGDDPQNVKLRVIPDKCCFENTAEFISSKTYRYNPVVYLFKRELVERYNCRFPVGIKLSEDQCFILKYLSHNPRILTIPEIFYYYIHNSSSAISSNTSTMSYADNIRVARLFAEYAHNYEDIDKTFIVNAVWRLFRDFFVCVAQQNKKEYDAKVQNVYNECYDKIRELYPSSLRDVVFRIARHNIMFGIFYWNHKNGIKSRLSVSK